MRRPRAPHSFLERQRRGYPTPGRLRKNELNWEPVHICLAWRLLFSQGWGFRGPVIGAGGTRHFEPDGVFFSTSLALPDPANRRRTIPSRCPSRLLTDRRRRFTHRAPSVHRAFMTSEIIEILL